MLKVSVIIPCYNYARFLPEAVESVAVQTCRDYEIIIVNDGSTDNTEEIALGLIEKYRGQEISLINQENLGVSVARNNGIKAAAGDYILPLDADDIIRPKYIEKTYEAMQENQDAGLVYTWSEKFGTENEIIKNGEFNLKNIITRNVPPCTALIRKSAWEKAGGYNPSMKRGGEDWEFYCSLFESGCLGVVIPDVLFRYRRHGISRIDNEQLFAIDTSRSIKLLHPELFEPFACKVSKKFARVLIWLKSFTRDPVTRFIYLRFPQFHKRLASIKYGLMK